MDERLYEVTSGPMSSQAPRHYHNTHHDSDILHSQSPHHPVHSHDSAGMHHSGLHQPASIQNHSVNNDIQPDGHQEVLHTLTNTLSKTVPETSFEQTSIIILDSNNGPNEDAQRSNHVQTHLCNVVMEEKPVAGQHCEDSDNIEGDDATLKDEIIIKDEEVDATDQTKVTNKRRGRAKVKKKARSKRSPAESEGQSEMCFTALMRKRRQDLTLGAKIKMLDMLDKEPKIPQSKIANLFRVSQSQVSRIVKNKEEILVQWSRFGTPDRKRCRLGKAGDLEEKLVDWYKQAKKEDLPISGPILMEKAKAIGNEMGIDFKPSPGWLGRWKDRNGVTLKKFTDKDGTPSVDKVANHWRRYMFAKATKEVPLQNVWVVDDTVLAFNSVPDFIPHGHNGANDIVSVIMACNLAGTERRPAAVVGKAQFLGSAHLPCSYHYHPKAALTLEFFSSWLREWDRELRSKKKKIVILLNKAAHHPENLHLFNIGITFLPQGTSNVLQPFRLGIIKTFKSLYRHLQLKLILSKIKANEHLVQSISYHQQAPQHSPLSNCISELDAVYFVYKAWRHVSPEIIVKGVVKAGLSKDVDALNVNDHVVPPPGISQQDFDFFVQSDVNIDMSHQDTSVAGKSGVSETLQQTQYSNMLDSVNGKSLIAHQSVDVTMENTHAPRVSEAVVACQVIRRYLQQQGGRLFDEFTMLESAIQIDMLLDSQPDLQNELAPDPVHDPSSVHSLEAQQHALEQKLDYVEKVRKEQEQQKIQREKKKALNSTAGGNVHGPGVAPAQEMQNNLLNQLIGGQKQNIHPQDLTARQELMHLEVNQQQQQHATMTQHTAPCCTRMSWDPNTDMSHQNSRQCSPPIELRNTNATTYRTAIHMNETHNDTRMNGKNDRMPVMPSDLRTMPGGANNTDLHHAAMAPGMSPDMRHDTRMGNQGLQYYDLQNPVQPTRL